VSAYLYILRCADNSYYVGTTVSSLDKRVAEHQAGAFDGYTARRRPVALVFHQHFQRLEDAALAERQVKGWRRDKKEALIRGEYYLLPSLARRGTRATALASFETRPIGPLLRMTKSSNLKDLPYAGEHPEDASRTIRDSQRRIE
jgi:predicted GIY-YIG superfamily endonuclease